MNRFAIAVSTLLIVLAGLVYMGFSGYLSKAMNKQAFVSTDITGSPIGKSPWALQDANGKSLSQRDFVGKVVVVFFGFTRCPDVCPSTMIDYAEVLKRLDSNANKVQVLFATLDPDRDTFPTLQQYTAAFNPSFIALRGDEAATKAAAAAFKVFYAKSKQGSKTEAAKPDAASTDNYTVDHTAASFVFDPKGNIRLFVRNGQDVDAVVKDLKALLK